MTLAIVQAKSAAARAACFAIRRAVFIDEQGIPEAEEWDAHDATCLHLLARDPDPVATARVIDGGGGLARIGRIAVMASRRGSGLGAAILRAAEDHAIRAGYDRAALDAQAQLTGFYERAGYRAVGPVFDDGSGILHRRMTKPRLRS